MATATPKTQLYEGMFLLSLHQTEEGPQGIDLVQQLLDRAEAEAVTLRRWDERKLAYPIASQKRGVYYFTYFKADPSKVEYIERDCNLTDAVLRFMILKAEHVGDVEVELEKQEAAAASVREKSEPGSGAAPVESKEVEAAEAEATVSASA